LSKPLRALPSHFLEVAVLVVEDEVLIGMMVASVLEDIGFSSVTIAANGQQALEAADAQDFGLIVSDIILEHSKLNGIDIVVSLMQRKPVPVVFITAHAGVAELQRIAAETPRAAVLRKPVVHRELHNAIAVLAGTWGTG
jgi:CheY-like chemotaxis protein